MAASRIRSSRRRLVRVGGVAAVVLAIIAGVAASAGFLDRDPLHLVRPRGPAQRIGVLYLSGDMGLRYGPNPHTVAALAAAGLPVAAWSTPALFGRRRDRGTVDAIIADAVRTSLARTGAARLMLVGQSYGADVLQTGLAALPADQRARIAGVVLIVPGETVYFRADPSGIAYRGTADSLARLTLPRLGWTSLTCIYGIAEPDSACPMLRGTRATVIAMPGGHFLDDDYAALADRVLTAIHRAEPREAVR